MAGRTTYVICKETTVEQLLKAADRDPLILPAQKVLVPATGNADLGGSLVRIRRQKPDMTNGTIRWIDE